jgi:hypothetical protein
MPEFTITYSTLEERRDYERAIAFVAEMRQLGLEAPHGRVIDACEALALSKGRDFLRDSLAGAVEARVAEIEKKGNRPVAIQREARGDGRGPW